MSAPQWKPGDVASIKPSPGYVRRMTAVRQQSGQWLTDNGYWPSDLTDVRPLVVIDAEDREQVAALRDALDPSQTKFPIAAYQAALRSLVTPPKPDEPQGLGAVVEDAEGRVFIRYGASLAPWIGAASNKGLDPDRPYRYWDGIAAVRVLSHGWTEDES